MCAQKKGVSSHLTYLVISLVKTILPSALAREKHALLDMTGFTGLLIVETEPMCRRMGRGVD